MKPVTREFRDEVLAVLLCWDMSFRLRRAWAHLDGAVKPRPLRAALRVLCAASASRNDRTTCHIAIATVERWPVLP